MPVDNTIEKQNLHARWISFQNMKGGTGKTVSAVTVGSELASRGNKVLLIDLDAQGNLTSIVMAGQDRPPKRSIFDALTLEARFDECIFQTFATLDESSPIRNNLFIIPGSRRFQPQAFSNGAKDVYRLMESREIIEEAFREITGEWPVYVILDSGPEAGILNTMTMLASSYAVNATLAAKLPRDGTKQFIADIRETYKYYAGVSVKPLGILITNYRPNTNVGKYNLEQYAELGAEFAPPFKTTIASSCRVDEASELGLPLQEYDQRCRTTISYQEFTDEMIHRIEQLEREEK